ncbi:MAG TPA: helix-turn-helix domain-containing protein [Solirubrobacterales bacterium]|nr:helix-turn-helix domain-containing protein [Solirubrobacterales bacterium]
MSADEIALAEREAAREPGVTRALRLAHSIGVSIDDLAGRIYWNPGEVARSPEDRRPASERLSGFFLVLPANVPIFDPPPRALVASRRELAEVFGENVRSARERRHLFQKTLAHAAGLSREGLSYIERGIHETTIETMLSIARALQVTPEVLLGGIAWEPRLPPCAPPRRGGAQGHKANSLDGPIKSLWNEGKTGGEIATALGVPRGTVSAIVHRLREHGENLPYRRPPTRAVHEGARRRRGRCVTPSHENDRAVELEETIDAANWKEASDAEITAWLGANVAHHRHAAGLTFRELGEAAELDRSYLNRIEKGELLPRLGLIVKLAGCFNVRCGRLTSGILWEPSFGAFRIEADGETDTPLKRLGQNALRKRRRIGVSQQALSSRASIDRNDVVDFEGGNRNFRVFTAVRLAGALRVDIAELFSGVADWYVRPLPAPEYAPGDRPPTKSERDAVLVRLWREGRPEREIAEALDLKPEAVGPYVRELRDAGRHLPYRRPPRRAVEIAARRRRTFSADHSASALGGRGRNQEARAQEEGRHLHGQRRRRREAEGGGGLQCR